MFDFFMWLIFITVILSLVNWFVNTLNKTIDNFKKSIAEIKKGKNK